MEKRKNGKTEKRKNGTGQYLRASSLWKMIYGKTEKRKNGKTEKRDSAVPP